MQHKPRPHSNQQAFDNVWQHFITEQHGPATDPEGFCRYRTDDNTNGCAIGCQLSDRQVKQLVRHGYARASIGQPLRLRSIARTFREVDATLLGALQRAHDAAAASGLQLDFHTELRRRLHALAAEFGLCTHAVSPV